MGVLGGRAVSYERGTPVGQDELARYGAVEPLSWPSWPQASHSFHPRKGGWFLHLIPPAPLLRRNLQGYLADKKPPPRRSLQYDHAWAPMAVLGGVRFLMSEVPL